MCASEGRSQRHAHSRTKREHENLRRPEVSSWPRLHPSGIWERRGTDGHELKSQYVKAAILKKCSINGNPINMIKGRRGGRGIDAAPPSPKQLMKPAARTGAEPRGGAGSMMMSPPRGYVP